MCIRDRSCFLRTLSIGVLIVASLGNYEIGASNLKHEEVDSTGLVKNGHTNQETNSANLTAAQINYNSYFDVLDGYIADIINSGEGSVKGSASAIYPGFLNIDHPRKTLAACIDWNSVKSTLLEGKIAPYAFSIRYGPSKDKVQSEALAQCKENTNYPEVDCESVRL